MRVKPDRWIEVFWCEHGHLHVVWYRAGKHEHVVMPLEKLANVLLEHGDINNVPRTIAIGILEARGMPRGHPKDMN